MPLFIRIPCLFYCYYHLSFSSVLDIGRITSNSYPMAKPKVRNNTGIPLRLYLPMIHRLQNMIIAPSKRSFVFLVTSISPFLENNKLFGRPAYLPGSGCYTER